ncbi:hypothetical protein T281_12055 [Rhodomicrobium udaipurense JA643]|nr:hypothetical protein T281_12055 [Rhodomicrobium udaipurense JA643]
MVMGVLCLRQTARQFTLFVIIYVRKAGYGVFCLVFGQFLLLQPVAQEVSDRLRAAGVAPFLQIAVKLPE